MLRKKKGFTQHHFSTKSGAGFTLIEILIALVVLGMGITLLITMFTVGMKGVIANQERTQATNLAQDLMDEILGKNFDENTPDSASSTAPGSLGLDSGEGTTNRSAWDDIDDYLQLKNGQSPPRDALNNELTLYTGFTRYASVWYVGSNLAESAVSTELKRISAWVSHSDISAVVITGLRTKSIY